MTERIEKDFGYLIMQDGNIHDYEGGETGNGCVYKDYEAFKSGKAAVIDANGPAPTAWFVLPVITVIFINIMNPIIITTFINILK